MKSITYEVELPKYLTRYQKKKLDLDDNTYKIINNLKIEDTLVIRKETINKYLQKKSISNKLVNVEYDILNDDIRQMEDEYNVFYTNQEEDFLKTVSYDELNKYAEMESIFLNDKVNEIPFKFRILNNTNIRDNNKKIIIQKLDKFNDFDEESTESSKYVRWFQTLEKTPLGIYKNPPIIENKYLSSYLQNIKHKLNESIYGHDNAKIEILQLILKSIKNPDSNGKAIGLCGPMGNGKTTFVKEGIANVMNRPFEMISLGGCKNSSFLKGHDFTYEGSTCGKIVEILQKCECMNPIILFDELDKISDTSEGKEIVNLLIHLIDPSQNNCFQDNYLSGIELDLSKCLFIFSFNDEKKINPVLKDRIHIINMKGFNVKDKIQIAENYLLPSISKEYNMSIKDIIFTKDIFQHIIQNYTDEKGVRQLKQSIETILSKLQLANILNIQSKDNLSREQMFLYKCKNIKFPYKIEVNIIGDLLIKHNEMNVAARMMYC